jgi:hypothetical protein
MADHILARMTSDKLTADLEYHMHLKEIYEGTVTALQTCLDEPIPVYGPHSQEQLAVIGEIHIVTQKVDDMDHAIGDVRDDIMDLAVEVADRNANARRDASAAVKRIRI